MFLAALSGAARSCVHHSAKTLMGSRTCHSGSMRIRYRPRRGPSLLLGLALSVSVAQATEVITEPLEEVIVTATKRGFEQSVGLFVDEAVLNNTQPFFTNIGYLRDPRRVWLQGTWRFID